MARDNLLKEFESNHTYYFITFFSKFEFFIMQYSVLVHIKNILTTKLYIMKGH